MITFPSLPLFSAAESLPAAAAGGEQPPLDAVFAQLLATATDALDLAAARDASTGGKALPLPGPDLPPGELASAELPAPGSELLLAQAPPSAAIAEELLQRAPGLAGSERGADLVEGANNITAPAENTSAAAVSLEADTAVEVLPLPVGFAPRQIAAPGEGRAAPATPSAQAMLSSAANSSSQPQPQPQPQPPSLAGSPPFAELAAAIAPSATTADPGLPRTEGLLPPASSATVLVQGEAPTQTLAPTALAAAESPLQSQAPPPQLRSPLPLPLQHAPQDPAFPGELANRLQVFVRNGMHEATLQLHPAELGRLQVSITTEGDQARVLFVADNAAAREAIEQSLPRLRELLAQSGLQLAHSDVSGQSLAGGQRDNGAGPASASSDTEPGFSDPGADIPPGGEGTLGTHLVDYYI